MSHIIFFFCSIVILKNLRGGSGSHPQLGFSRITMQQKRFFSWNFLTFSIHPLSTLCMKKIEDRRFLVTMATILWEQLSQKWHKIVRNGWFSYQNVPKWNFWVQIRNQRLQIPPLTKFQLHRTKLGYITQIWASVAQKFDQFQFWSYEAEIWYGGLFWGADYEFQLRNSI